MDFGALLHMAKKNSEDNKNDNKYYSTKFAPPKKVSKEKKLSDNIQKFLQKKEQEERAKQREQKEKLDNLLSMRDEKSKNKIRKMLKVTKSANRSVLDDAINTEHTAISMTGPDQPDQDDYGYVSTEANSFYQKYIDKVKDVKEDKGFAPSRPQSLKDLSGTKERVKAAITREIEEKNNHTRTRTVTTTSSPSVKVARTHSSSSKPLYDPEAERKAEDEERKRREDEERRNRMKNRKPGPPLMDFQALLKLAEKKQHEPVAVLVVDQKKKEPERLLTFKEKKELEERQRSKEAKERRDRERHEESKRGVKDTKTSTSTATTQRMEPNGRIPKLNQAGPSSSSSSSSKSSSSSISSEKKAAGSHEFKKPFSSSSLPVKPSSSSSTASSSSSLSNTKSSLSSSSSAKSGSKPTASTSSSNSKSSSSNSAPVKNPYGTSKSKQPFDGAARQFPPRDTKSVKAREFPPPDVPKSRQFPPPDVRRGPPSSSSSRYADSKKNSAPKRRILDDYDDDSEYDSELDDFIDDGDCEEDISSHIKAIFGYDKSKYRNLDDGDDRAMESSFAQVQREEFISKKIGIQEDLDDMKLEAMMKKRKMIKKRRLLEED